MVHTSRGVASVHRVPGTGRCYPVVPIGKPQCILIDTPVTDCVGVGPHSVKPTGDITLEPEPLVDDLICAFFSFYCISSYWLRLSVCVPHVGGTAELKSVRTILCSSYSICCISRTRSVSPHIARRALNPLYVPIPSHIRPPKSGDISIKRFLVLERSIVNPHKLIVNVIDRLCPSVSSYSAFLLVL